MKNKFILLFVFALCSLFAREEVDILFYLQDAGETYALMPVMRELQVRKIGVKVLTAGVAENLVSSEFSRLSFPGLTVDMSWTRDQLANPENLDALIEAVEPRLVVTGVAYALQGQVLDAFSGRQISGVAYWDNFNFDGENPYFKTAQAVARRASHLFVPTYALEAVFHTTRPVLTVGQPTLEQWKKEIRSMEPNALRQQLGICSCKNVLLFIGGYGEEYQKSFKLFIDSLSQPDGPSQLFLLVQLHPKSQEGAFERSAFEGVDFPYRILNNEVTTKEAVALSTLVACHESTVSFQALAAGKPVIHFIPRGQSFDTVLLKKGLAKKVTEPSEFPAAWEEALKVSPSADFLEAIGAPKNSAVLCADALIELLK